jgi:hypothetical protein
MCATENTVMAEHPLTLADVDRPLLKAVADALAEPHAAPVALSAIQPRLPAGLRDPSDLRAYYSIRALINRGLLDGDAPTMRQTLTVKALTSAGREVLGKG